MRTEAQQRQLRDAQAASHSSPIARAKMSAAMKRRWRDDPNIRAKLIAAAQTPEARAKRANSQRRPLADRFWGKVSPEPNSGCWLWLGAVGRKGYGQLRVDGRCVLATHVSLQLIGDPKPFPAACARHKCDNPSCVNPDHLEWGSQRDNVSDALQRNRADLSGLAVGHAKMRALKAVRPWVGCEHCGKHHQPRRDQLRKNKHFFCSTACSRTWQKDHYTGHPGRSWRGQ